MTTKEEAKKWYIQTGVIANNVQLKIMTKVTFMTQTETFYGEFEYYVRCFVPFYDILIRSFAHTM